MRRNAVIALFGAGAAAAFAAGIALGWSMANRQSPKTENTCCQDAGSVKAADVLSAETKVSTEKEPEESAANKETQPSADHVSNERQVAAEPPTMKVLGVEYKGDNCLDVHLSERPDMDVVRRYVEAAPLVEGALGFTYRTKYNYKKGEYEPHLRITGDFAYRTNVVVVIRKGLPLYGKGGNPNATGSLASDWSYEFMRKDAKPYVKFAADGRYLPPGGKRAIMIEAMNVTNLLTGICRVEPNNVVQMLAREEGVYSKSYHSSADEEATGELAGEMETNTIRCVNRANEKEALEFPLAMKDCGRANGIYLVAIRNGDFPRRDYTYWWDEDSVRPNPNCYRVVCVSDLGISVRTAGDTVGVWVTSLTTGKPVEGAWISVYSSANIKIADGRTDAGGWCAVKHSEKAEPFAAVVISPEADDMSFIALRSSMAVDETYPDGAREPYLEKNDCSAFVWTERGIYRHGENIFLHALLRDGTGSAPKPFPAELVLRNPSGVDYSRVSLLPDEKGALRCDKFSVPAEQPSGIWSFVLKTPGKDGRTLGEREVKIEEFAPPQIRVTVSADERQTPSNFMFAVTAEHLYGGPARALGCEGAVVFEDVPFAPAGWKGYVFGNSDRGLKPSFRRLSRRVLDDDGRCVFEAPLWADTGLPKAAVRATAQGTVFEDGGRPATARKSEILHYYPYYIGSSLSEWVKLPSDGMPSASLVCVTPDGQQLKESRALTLEIEKIDSVYSYRRNDDGWNTWDATRIRTKCADDIAVVTSADGPTEIKLPLSKSGDYAVTITDKETGVSFGRTFYLSDWGDEAVRAPLANPTEVTVVPDKAFYRPGEIPRLVVKSPFAGEALLCAFRDGLVHAETLSLTNATSEVALPAALAEWAPNVDVTLSVVHGVDAGANHLAARARGQTTIVVRRPENELSVSLDASVEMAAEMSGGSMVKVDVSAEGDGASDAVAVLTVVDEGINLLTGEETPDPIKFFAQPRMAYHTLYDLYHRLLPVVGDGLKANGVKTGGGFGAEMLGRVSPVPTRRFKPLALWQEKVPLADGKAKAVFRLPEFVGEVRITAVAYTDSASGSASVRRKVAPKIVVQPDAPRFVAPGDVFEFTLPIANRSGEAGEVSYEVVASGAVEMKTGKGGFALAKDASTNLHFAASAKATGEGEIRFATAGFGEAHATTINLPVRPAVAWAETAGVLCVEPGNEVVVPGGADVEKRVLQVSGSAMGELVAALDWLAEYPHGCLEQTASRIFPLVSAGGIFNALAGKKSMDRAEYVAAGVKRVESMLRAYDFVMWPDCDYAPWDKEVSLYAAHFLIEAEKAGAALSPNAKEKVLKFLGRWALSTNDTVSAYACHTLAIAGKPEKDRMFRLYDRLGGLSLLSRARLARAFVAIGDRPRAEALLKNAMAPDSVKEASFALLALLDMEPSDERVPQLVRYLTENRDKAKLSWGTTESNAHALLAIGAYYRHHPVSAGKPQVEVLKGGRKEASLSDRDVFRSDGADEIRLVNSGGGTAFVSWKALSLPDALSVTNESSVLAVSRRYYTADSVPADMKNLRCGDMLIVELSVSSDTSREFSDLVVEDLFAGAFEPIHSPLDSSQFPCCAAAKEVDWVMRSDARDDRMLVFSKKFSLSKGESARFFYPVRVVSAGRFALPGPSVESMYAPSLHARCAADIIKVRRQ